MIDFRLIEEISKLGRFKCGPVYWCSSQILYIVMGGDLGPPVIVGYIFTVP